MKITANKIPSRLGLGKVIKAPEFFGCMNTGRRPCLGRPKIFQEYSAINLKGFRFAVGPELYLMEAVKRYLFGKATHATKDEPKVKGKTPCYTVKFYKTYKAALREFRKQWDAQTVINERMAAEANQAAQQARSNDPNEMMEGILKLADY